MAQVLIVSSERDFSTDYVVAALAERGTSYFRINREQFPTSKIFLDPVSGILDIELDGIKVQFARDTLKSVYFRAPVYLREALPADSDENNQLCRSQWAAFLRALTIFTQAHWTNYPQATYLSEIKSYQLYQASKIGFRVPRTAVGNALPDWIASEEFIVIKSLDSAIIRRGKETGFTFTQFLSRAELAYEDISAIPVIVQESLDPKLDVRVFVVGKRMTSIAITDEIGHPISGDWRIHPSQVKCAIYNTPRDVLEKCQLLVQALGLNFAAIDLAVHHGEHFFLEVNPTGEWGWVMDIPGVRLDQEIAELLDLGNS